MINYFQVGLYFRIMELFIKIVVCFFTLVLINIPLHFSQKYLELYLKYNRIKDLIKNLLYLSLVFFMLIFCMLFVINY